MSIEIAFIRLMIRFERMKFVVSFQSVIAKFFENSFKSCHSLVFFPVLPSWLAAETVVTQSKSRNQALTQRGTAESDTKDLEEFPVYSDTQGKSQVDKRCKSCKRVGGS